MAVGRTGARHSVRRLAGWSAAVAMALGLTGCAPDATPTGQSLRHGDSVPRVTLTRVHQGDLVTWLATTSNADTVPITITSVEAVSVPDGVVADGFTAVSPIEVPALGWVGPTPSGGGVASASQLTSSAIEVGPGAVLPGVQLRFRVTRDLGQDVVSISGVRWTYTRAGVTHTEHTQQILRLTALSELPPAAQP